LMRRLRRAAQAHLAGSPVVEARPRAEKLDRSAIIHIVTDAFADRVLGFGMLHPATEDGKFTFVLPKSAAEEWPAFRELTAGFPPRSVLLHFGAGLRKWHEEHAFSRDADPSVEARFVDLQKRLKGAAIYPAPVILLPDFVEHGLDRDPLRGGHAGAAAMWALEDDGDARLEAKLRTDLLDLAALKAQILDMSADGEVIPEPAPRKKRAAKKSASKKTTKPVPDAKPAEGGG
jgi:hypothetical protein